MIQKFYLVLRAFSDMLDKPGMEDCLSRSIVSTFLSLLAGREIDPCSPITMTIPKFALENMSDYSASGDTAEVFYTNIYTGNAVSIHWRPIPPAWDPEEFTKLSVKILLTLIVRPGINLPRIRNLLIELTESSSHYYCIPEWILVLTHLHYTDSQWGDDLRFKSLSLLTYHLEYQNPSPSAAQLRTYLQTVYADESLTRQAVQEIAEDDNLTDMLSVNRRISHMFLLSAMPLFTNNLGWSLSKYLL